MNEPLPTELAGLVAALRGAPDIALYTDVFPRLGERHPHALLDETRTPRAEAAAALTAAARRGPSDLAAAVQAYRDRGELPALKAVADAEAVARATVDWQRKTNDLLRTAESRAALCDAEGVPCRAYLTWAKRVNQVREKVGGELADNPASQAVLIHAALSEVEQALTAEKQSLQGRLARATEDLAHKEESLEERDVEQAREYADSARKLIAGDTLIPALRKLGLLEGLLAGRLVRAGGEGCARLPLPQRRNPLGRHEPGPPRGKAQGHREQAGDRDEAGQEGAQAPQATERIPSHPHFVAEVRFPGAGRRERLRRPHALRRPHRPRDQDEKQADDGEEGATAPALPEGIEARVAGLCRPVQHPGPLPDPELGGAEPEGALAAEALAPDVVLDDWVVSHAVLSGPALQGHDGAFGSLRPPPPDGGVEASESRTQEQSAAEQREQAAAAKRVGALLTDRRSFVHRPARRERL
jgi:hypothetical protein